MASTNPQPRKPRLMSLVDVAHRVGFSTKVLYEMRRLGRMPPPAPVGFGGKIRWHPDVIEAWLRGEWQPVGTSATADSAPAPIHEFATGPAPKRRRPGPRRMPT